MYYCYGPYTTVDKLCNLVVSDLMGHVNPIFRCLHRYTFLWWNINLFQSINSPQHMPQIHHHLLWVHSDHLPSFGCGGAHFGGFGWCLGCSGGAWLWWLFHRSCCLWGRLLQTPSRHPPLHIWVLLRLAWHLESLYSTLNTSASIVSVTQNWVTVKNTATHIFCWDLVFGVKN